MTTATKNAIDWKAADAVAKGLGLRTRALVAAGEPQAVIDWSLRLARETSTSLFTEPRAVSYLELAVLVGHTTPPPKAVPPDRDARLDWIEKKLESLGRELQSVGDATAAIAAESTTSGSEEAKPDE
jgi:hypothetical protein